MKFVCSLSLLLVLAFALSALALSARLDAAPDVDAEESAQVQLPDRQVRALLPPAQRRAWDDAQEQLEQGKDLVESGDWNLAREESDLGFSIRVKEAHEIGKQQKERGKALVEEARATLVELRKVARQRYIEGTQFEPVRFEMRVPASNWADGTRKMAQDLMQKVWDSVYGRVYLGGVWEVQNRGYTARPALADDLQGIFNEVDSDHYTFIAYPDFEFGSRVTDGKLEVTFPESERILTNFRTALVVVELLLRRGDEDYLVSMRAVDMKTLEIIGAVQRIVPASELSQPTTGTAEDSSEADAIDAGISADAGPPAKNEGGAISVTAAPGEGADAAESTAVPVWISLEDRKEFIPRVTQGNGAYLFGFGADPGSTAFARDRATTLYYKTLLAGQTRLELSDADFLWLVLPHPRGETPDTTGDVVWRITGMESDGPAALYEVAAVAVTLENRPEVEVGVLEVQDSLETDSSME